MEGERILALDSRGFRHLDPVGCMFETIPHALGYAQMRTLKNLVFMVFHKEWPPKGHSL